MRELRVRNQKAPQKYTRPKHVCSSSKSPAFPGGQDRGSPRPSNHPKQARRTVESHDAGSIAEEEGQVMAAAQVRLGSPMVRWGGSITPTLPWEPFFWGTFNGSISGKHFFGKFGNHRFLGRPKIVEIFWLQMGWKDSQVFIERFVGKHVWYWN